MFLLKLCFSILILAQSSDESQFQGLEPSPVKNPNPITMVASAQAVCPDELGSLEKNCEKIIIHEVALKKLRFLFVDSRNHKRGSFDANELLRHPADYNGEIKTIDLETLFEDSQGNFKSVSVFFEKDDQIKIQIQTTKKTYKKIIPQP